SVTAPTSRSYVLATVVFLIGLGTASVGLWLNATFLRSFGRGSEAGMLLAVIGLVTDAATLVLPSVTTGLYQRRRFGLLAISFVMYAGAVTTTTFSALGFFSTNIGDAVSSRGAVTGERTTLERDIAKLKAERDGLVFERTTQQAVDDAKAAVAREC